MQANSTARLRWPTAKGENTPTEAEAFSHMRLPFPIASPREKTGNTANSERVCDSTLLGLVTPERQDRWHNRANRPGANPEWSFPKLSGRISVSAGDGEVEGNDDLWYGIFRLLYDLQGGPR